MISRFFHALLAAGVVASAAAAASYGVTHWMGEGAAREVAERWVTAPGRVIYARLNDTPELRRLGARARRKVDLERLRKSHLSQEALKVAGRASSEAAQLCHLYNLGTWAGIGFVVCFLVTLVFGIASIGAALKLGFRVAVTMIFLQGALILAGVLALQKAAG